MLFWAEYSVSKSGHQDQFFDFLRHDHCFFSQFGDVIFIGIRCFFDKPVYPESLDESTDLSVAEPQQFLDILVFETADVEFTMQDSQQYGQIIFIKQSHSSHPRNPVLAEACFRGGFIDSWGSGINKIMDSCKAAGLPTPDINEKEGGFIVTLFKDNLAEEQLVKFGLNQRQMKAVLYVKEKGKITNKEYQEINSVARRWATVELTDLVEKNILKNIGYGAGSQYELIVQ